MNLNGNDFEGNLLSGNLTQEIRNNVFEFYAKHRGLCDLCYDKAEDFNIYNIYEKIEEVEARSLLSRVSIVVLSANKYENNVLHQNIYSNFGCKIKQIVIELQTACHSAKKVFAYLFNWGKYMVLHINANVTGSYTIGGSADIVRWILNNEYIFPTCIISYGICFGTDEKKNNLSDVIISKKVYPYFVGAKIKGKKLTVVDDNMFVLGSNLSNNINSLKTQNRFKDIEDKREIKVFLENYITGEAVVSSESAREVFVNITTQNIYAGDMEGYGLFKECNSLQNSIPCFVVKSICDWGIEKNFDSTQEDVVNDFKNYLIKYFPNETETNSLHIMNLVDTLKDRIQAYAADCAFSVLNRILECDVLNLSVYDQLKKWFLSFNGIATRCDIVKDKIISIVKLAGNNPCVSNKYIHTCLELLHNEKIIECDEDCLNNKNYNLCENGQLINGQIKIIKK